MTDQQIDEFLEMLAKSPTSARDMVRGLFAAHEAKAAPAVPQGWKVERKSDLRIRVESPSGDAWSFENVDDRGSSNLFVYQMLDAMLAASPAAPSQPVNRPQNCGTSFCSCIECVCEPSQPVTLTDEEIGDLARPYGRSSINGFAHIKGFARAIIAALREKQGGV